ncbi:MAG TPA: DJ-1/PfpI family protein [Natronosporangium sp.]
METTRSWRRFALHYLAMVLAMLAGMFVLGGAIRASLGLAGVEYSLTRFPELVILEMGLTMALGMVGWMWFRGHRWPATLEMAGAMLAPAVALVPLVWLAGLDGGTAIMLEHIVMFPLMLLVMLRRRDEYAMAHRRHRPVTRPAGGRRPLRVAGKVVAGVLAFLLLPGVFYLAGARAYEATRYGEPAADAAGTVPLASAPTSHDPERPTAVVVIGGTGANVADALAPYEVLATTGAFNVYTVAPERRLVPLLGRLDLLPDLSFAELDRLLGGAPPDITIVPEIPSEPDSDAAVAGWLRDTASGGLVVGVCRGARLLAAAGLLTGRPATSHWYRIAGLQAEYPDVDWRREVRYVDDGDVITTGGLLSGVDGALRVVERLLGTEAAAAAARTVGWRYYSPGEPGALPASRLRPTDALLHLVNIGFRANETNLGVLLTDGIGEAELASAFAPYAEVKAGRLLSIAVDGGTIRSRHGLTFVPRADLAAIDRVERLLVPGAEVAANPPPEAVAAADRAEVPIDYLHAGPGFAFDGALREIASHTDVPSAHWTAKVLEYSTADLALSGPNGPWAPAMRPLALGLLGLAVLVGLSRLRVRSAGRSAGP